MELKFIFLPYGCVPNKNDSSWSLRKIYIKIGSFSLIVFIFFSVSLASVPFSAVNTSMSLLRSLRPARLICFFLRCVARHVEMFQFRWKLKKRRRQQKKNLSNYLEKHGKSLFSLRRVCSFLFIFTLHTSFPMRLSLTSSISVSILHIKVKTMKRNHSFSFIAYIL